MSAGRPPAGDPPWLSAASQTWVTLLLRSHREAFGRPVWAGLEAGSMHSHMNHEGHAQLFVRMTTRNFEEAIKARRDKRKPEFKD